MEPKCKVLWIENGVRHEVAHLAAPVVLDGKYDLIVAEDASAGIAQALASKFDVIIVDIRLPPGQSPEWVHLYQGLGGERFSARLGLSLLYTLLGHPDAWIDLGPRRPAWITPFRIGVLTVESKSELDEDLIKLGITVHAHKRAEISEEVLLELIQEVETQIQKHAALPPAESV